jgi:hypothetical protein
MQPLNNRLKRPIYTETTENRFRFSERTAGRVEPDRERPDGRRRPLSLLTFKLSVSKFVLSKSVSFMNASSQTCSLLN